MRTVFSHCFTNGTIQSRHHPESYNQCIDRITPDRTRPLPLCQVDLEPPQQMVAQDAELLVVVLERHLVRMLRVARQLQMLDFTTFAIQVSVPISATGCLACLDIYMFSDG